MTPQSQPRKPKNSSKVNLTISAVVHGILIVALLYFAAREGYLGKKIQTITVTKVQEKKPEPEKPKEPPKAEPPKIETPKVEPPKVEAPKVAPPVTAPPVVAPAAVEMPSFEFAGGKAVNSENDPVQLYKGYIEYSLRLKWNRPEDLPDENYVAEIAVNVDKQGNISQPRWLKGSGDEKWDQSVRNVFKIVSNINRRPPTNFPPAVTIRFDVQEQTEPVLQ
ncbi:MAG: TonB C-terminal domain-containing protein [Limisphaerales bacterium]